MNWTAVSDKLRPLLEGKNRTRLALLVGIAAIALILLSECSGGDNAQVHDDFQDMTPEQYAASLEEELEEIISSIDGAGRTKVMVTLRSGVEYVYASEDRSSLDTSQSTGSGGQQSSDSRQDSENSFIIIEDKDGKHALVRTELAPTVSGVVVVCEGAGSAAVRQRIEQVVTTALNISSKRVCITQLSSQEELSK